MRWLPAAAASSTCFLLVAFGTLVPLRNATDITYLFAWPGGTWLATYGLAAAVALTIAFFGMREFVRRRAPENLAAAASGAWLSPLVPLALVVLGILPAVPHVGVAGAPIAFLLYDLRWWWAAIAVAGVVARADWLLGRPLWGVAVRVMRPHSRLTRRLAVGCLALGLMACAWFTTPLVRFSGTLHGDEPKYLRFCEVWYQGNGLDISSNKPFSQTRDAPPRLAHNVTLLVTALWTETLAMTADVRAFAADPFGFRWLRTSGGEGYVNGKNGGVYQIHQPGLSLLLLPGYLLDRGMSSSPPGYADEFPLYVRMTEVTLLLMYGACAAALFVFFRHALASGALAMAWAAMAMLTLPTAAFAFQIYPELPALFAIVTVTTYVLFQRASSPREAMLAGAACGALGWLHPRFLTVSLVLALAAVFMRPAGERRRFLAAFAIGVFTLCLYDYHVTGSWLPTALWDANQPGAIGLRGVPVTLLAYLVHPRWGLLPHAPILALAIPGFALLWRRSSRQAALLALIGLSLAVPAAGHTLSAAGGTPGRLILAVVPLFFWPVAVAVRHLWPSRLFRCVVVLLAVVSVHAAASYNLHHLKAVGVLVDARMSGWAPNLAFPAVREQGWTQSPGIIALLLVLAATAVAVAVFSVRRTPPAPREPPVPAHVAMWTAVILAAAAVLTGMTTITGVWFHDDYLPPERDAHRMAARALVAVDPCRLCFTSAAPAIDWSRLRPNPAQDLRVDSVVTGDTLRLAVAVDGPDGWAGFGRVKIDFGDQTSSPAAGVVEHRTFAHRYRTPGTYDVVTRLTLADGEQRSDRRVVTVAATR